MEPFKNLLSADAAKKISVALQRADQRFNAQAFLAGIRKDLEPLELKQRVAHLTERLERVLPSDPKKSFPILVNAIRQSPQDETGVSSLLVWPFTHFVMKNGLNNVDLSLKTLHALTQVFTAEFAIRPFLIHHQDQTLLCLEKWLADPSDDVRRLISEGSRPLLPWGERIPAFVKDPKITWHLLEELKNDPAKYVQKSVANHLNDHSKNHGDWLVKKLKVWTHSPKVDSKVEWIVRHGTRTLVKKGHLEALQLHGISSVDLKVQRKVLTPRVKMGEFLEVQLRITNPTDDIVRVMVDHELLLLKANGAHSGKVFKGVKLQLAGGETRTLELKLRIKPVTTRTYYFGKQGWAPSVNGVKPAPLWFELIQA